MDHVPRAKGDFHQTNEKGSECNEQERLDLWLWTPALILSLSQSRRFLTFGSLSLSLSLVGVGPCSPGLFCRARRPLGLQFCASPRNSGKIRP